MSESVSIEESIKKLIATKDQVGEIMDETLNNEFERAFIRVHSTEQGVAQLEKYTEKLGLAEYRALAKAIFGNGFQSGVSFQSLLNMHSYQVKYEDEEDATTADSSTATGAEPGTDTARSELLHSSDAPDAG